MEDKDVSQSRAGIQGVHRAHSSLATGRAAPPDGEEASGYHSERVD